MKSNSTIYPNKFIESNEKIYIINVDSIEEITKNEQMSYTYEMYELPIAHRDNLAEYIENNHSELLDFAIKKHNETLIIPTAEETDKAKRELEIIELLSELGVV